MLALAGCEDSGAPSGASVEIGRYRFISAANGYPGMVLDTATGCMEQLWAKGEGQDIVVQKAEVDFGAMQKDRACSATGITSVSTGKAQ
jgi:hypothetical protein